ncbi:MAG: hypothetical protein U0L09_03185 [Christensenellales bacterium]|nr:hypothetical protein [Christensenellales bacterium]
MSKICIGNSGGDKKYRLLGIALMASGILVLLISIPGWMWATLLGILLFSIGFLVWRFV